MNQPPSPYRVEALNSYSESDAAQIGKLLASLSDKFDGSPISGQLLRNIIDSPYHEQLIARSSEGVVVGAATLNIIMGAGIGRKAWLDDFVVDPSLQGSGVGSLMWDAMIEWCKLHNIAMLSFTSNPKRVAAHRFYLKRGAEIYETDYFKKAIQ